MPIRVRKLPGRNKYRVTEGGRVRAQATTKAKAVRQVRLLRGIAAGWKPARKVRTTSMRATGAGRRTR